MKTLYVASSGSPHAPSIIFLHGAGASSWMWADQTAAMVDFHCLNVDLPGHGHSNHLSWLSLGDTAEQLAAIIRAQANHARAHVVGLSLGGYLALKLLERHPEVVDRVVISGVTAAPIPNSFLLHPQLTILFAAMRSRRLVGWQAKLLGLSPSTQANFTENVLATSLPAYRRIAEEVVDFQVPPLLRTCHNAVLVTAGTRESAIIRQAVEVIAKLMPNAQGRLANGRGHGWNVEDPALFNAMLRAWFTGNALPHGLQPTSI